jgi:hypothetical protein
MATTNIFENIGVLNGHMGIIPKDKPPSNIKFTLGTIYEGQFVPQLSETKLSEIYKKLSDNKHFKYSCIDRKICNVPGLDNASECLILHDNLTLSSEVTTISEYIIQIIPGWTYSFNVIISDITSKPARKKFKEEHSIMYHCDRFCYKEIWSFDLITLIYKNKSRVFMFELVFHNNKLPPNPLKPEYYIQSAVAKMLDFSEQL